MPERDNMLDAEKGRRREIVPFRAERFKNCRERIYGRACRRRPYFMEDRVLNRGRKLMRHREDDVKDSDEGLLPPVYW